MIKGIGTDIVEIERLRTKDISKWKGRIFTEAEFSYASKFSDPFPHLAGFFAAKESAIKALSDKSIALNELEIDHTPNGKPFFRYETQDSVLHLSISHEKKYAIAFVTWEQLKKNK